MNGLLMHLAEWGADPFLAIERMMGDEALYTELLRKALRDGEIDVLRAQIQQKQYIAAFRTAHKLKGSAVILGLTPYAAALSTTLELLRPVYEEHAAMTADREKKVCSAFCLVNSANEELQKLVLAG